MTEAQQGELSGAGLVTLGRIEERLIGMKENESRNGERLDKVEQGLNEVKNELSAIRATTKPKAPWYAVVGGVVGIISGVGSLIALVAVLKQIGTIAG